jgi:hypothetical protein
MNRIYNFYRLSPSSRSLLIKSILLLSIVRVGLWLLPFQTVRWCLALFARGHTESHARDQRVLEQVVWAVAAAARSVPGATCLTQALVTQALLSRRGYQASLCIGVARGETGEFQAHAWVECQGKVVLGGVTAPSRFTTLLALKEERS